MKKYRLISIDITPLPRGGIFGYTGPTIIESIELPEDENQWLPILQGLGYFKNRYLESTDGDAYDSIYHCYRLNNGYKVGTDIGVRFIDIEEERKLNKGE